LGKLIGYLTVFFLGATKFQVAFLVAGPSGLTFLETLVITIGGGLSGVAFFMFLSRYLTIIFKKIREGFSKSDRSSADKKKRLVFKPWKRYLISFMRKFGLPGIAIITPPVLSIPLGVILAERINSKFVKKRNLVFIYMAVSVVFWSFVFSGLWHV
jgi:hypothetical protein